MTLPKGLEALADEWLRIDKDPLTRDEIYRLIKDKKHAELQARLGKRIQFGTAGLRARMEAGFSRMNSVTVIQASQGLAAYLLSNVDFAQRRGVVIGYDARHNSEKFARLAAAAFVAKGFGMKVWFYETPVHTPMVPFGVVELKAAAGIMITASHNPAMDNGYKVYAQNGCQIIPPMDRGIADAIEKHLEPVSWDEGAVEESLLVEPTFAHCNDKYLDLICKSVDPDRTLAGNALKIGLKFSYTALHGVGLRPMEQLTRLLGIEESLVVVQEQAHPDPDFPSVKFPNPEEKGALDMAKASADRRSVSIIVANDPDADRFSVCEKVNGIWHQFSGNQLGALLGTFILSSYKGDRKRLCMLASTVSSRMLAVIAEVEGFKFEETLTGFKWMGNRGMDLENEGFDVCFAFEESLGYMIPSVVFDKDGIAAAALFLVATVKWQTEKGLTPWGFLQNLYEKYGYFEEANTYLRTPSPEKTQQVFNDIRDLGKPHPKTMGGVKVRRWADLTLGWDSATPDHKPTLPVDSTSQMIICELEGEVRLIVRASGTEPKIKVYIECRAKDRENARTGAQQTLERVLLEWLKPEENGLEVA